MEVHAPPIYPGVALVYSWPSRTPRAEPSSLDLVAEFDARAAQRKAATAAEFQQFDVERKQAKRKRRTPAEMRQFRADKARQITQSYNSLVPAETREWLDEPDEMLEGILEAQREKD